MQAIRPGTPLLFFDLVEIEELHNVHRVVVPAVKHRANPILTCGDLGEWDSRRAGPWASRSVIYDADERLFKMWYSGYPTAAGGEAIRPQRTGYAVSHDGAVWEKPALRLFEFDGDGGANNICIENIGSVIKDDAEADPNRRYKLFLKKPQGVPDAMGVAYSPDGIRWGSPVAIPEDIWEGRRYDTVAFVLDDQDPDERRRYKLVWQELTESAKPGTPPRVRNKHLAFGPTELSWRPSQRNPIIDPNGGNEHEIHFLAYVPYRGQYLLLYEFGWYHPDGTGRYGRYSADIRIAHSRDGERFTRIRDDQQLIARGLLGDWDDPVSGHQRQDRRQGRHDLSLLRGAGSVLDLLAPAECAGRPAGARRRDTSHADWAGYAAGRPLHGPGDAGWRVAGPRAHGAAGAAAATLPAAGERLVAAAAPELVQHRPPGRGGAPAGRRHAGGPTGHRRRRRPGRMGGSRAWAAGRPDHPLADPAVRARTPAQPDLAAALSQDGARPG